MASTVAPASSSLSVTLAQAITYLTRSLITCYSATTVIKLQLALEANLTAQFASNWFPTEPLRGSGRRCLTLSPTAAPPRAIYMACKSAGVEWSKWISLLGGVEFDLFVDPGCISVRFGNWDATGKSTKLFTIWSEQLAEEKRTKKQQLAELQLQAQLRAQAHARSAAALAQSPSRTVAQQLMEEDEEEELFAMIAHEVREPTWLTPILTQFPSIPPVARSNSSSPASSVDSAVYSRSSSRASNSSSSFSFSSRDSVSSATTVSSPDSEKPLSKLSRRERARQAKVFIDASKTDVTNYDGGKTTVLTGGVMLGGGAPKAKTTSSHKKTTSSISGNWRALRA